MKNIHTRILVLNYFEDDVPVHDTKEEQDKWYAALGRMVAYGLRNERNKAEQDTMQYVSLGFRKNPLEIDACYESSVSYQNMPSLNSLREELSRSNRFVMGAVLHSDGEWGFHS